MLQCTPVSELHKRILRQGRVYSWVESEVKGNELLWLTEIFTFVSLVQVNVFGFGADSRGNWHHYWEQNRYSGEFRKTGVHDADFEAQIIDSLAKAGKITVFPGK